MVPPAQPDKLCAAVADGVPMVVQDALSAIGNQIIENIHKYNLRNLGKETVSINVSAEAPELTS
ncbi:hypothetical protein ACSFA3_21465 [Variovorax sp. RHLX14]|uniref:hypothetical protein n=1 Tax=Variovorax sp. RHLX14 TaxID=1259731 RepID=UPI003F478A9C